MLCAVLGERCTVRGCPVNGGVEPSALPCAHLVTGLARRSGRVHASTTTTCYTSLLEKVDLPVLLLDPYVEFAQVAGELISLGS